MRYCRPRNVSHAVEILGDAGSAGRILVGGTDLLVAVRRKPLIPLVVVDIKTADDLPPAIDFTVDSVVFGPTATMNELGRDSKLATMFPALVAASRVVGSVAIRNRASLIGNICNASPAADTAPALLVHGAAVTIVGPGGERTIPLEEFFVGPGKTKCQPGELVIALEVPLPEEGYASAFERLTRRRGVDLATVSVAAGVDPEGSITLGLGAVAPTPVLTETGDPVDFDDQTELDQTVRRLVSVASPISDVRAGREYRVAMTEALAKKAVRSARLRVDSGGPSGGPERSN